MPPTFLKGFWAARGRPEPQNDRFSSKSLNRPLLYHPFWRHERRLSLRRGLLEPPLEAGPRGRGPHKSQSRPRKEFQVGRPRKEFQVGRPRKEFQVDRPRKEFQVDRPRNEFQVGRPRNEFQVGRSQSEPQIVRYPDLKAMLRLQQANTSLRTPLPKVTQC